MPELPEVETTRRGIAPYLLQHKVRHVVVRDSRLRWPVPADVRELEGQVIRTVERRGKYILLGCDKGTALIHLGMSGSLRLSEPGSAYRTHDHVELQLKDTCLRLHDPRRFGCFLWTHEPALQHPLLADLGPEPLSDDFSGKLLFERSRGRIIPVKQFIMDSHIVVGVGNIYAQESLFRAGIHPGKAAGKISAARYDMLAKEIRKILAWAIERGGTTLRDFVNGHGDPGYFQLELAVYGRGGEACRQCGHWLKEIRQSGRSTVFCTHCQR